MIQSLTCSVLVTEARLSARINVTLCEMHAKTMRNLHHTMQNPLNALKNSRYAIQNACYNLYLMCVRRYVHVCMFAFPLGGSKKFVSVQVSGISVSKHYNV